jgi:Ankyrin repeat
VCGSGDSARFSFRSRRGRIHNNSRVVSMPWFWGSRAAKSVEDDEEYDDDEYTDDDDDEDASYESYTDEEEEVGPEIVSAAATAAAAASVVDDSNVNDEDGEASSGIQAQELALLMDSPRAMKDSELEAAPTTEGAVVLDCYQPRNAANLDEDDALLAAGILPSVVGGYSHTAAARERLPSAISMDSNEDEIMLVDLEDSTETAPLASDDVQHKASSAMKQDSQSTAKNNEPEEEVTTLQDKQSLLVLAAEHDRVDILQAILSASNSDPEMAQQRAFLLNPIVPTAPIKSSEPKMDGDEATVSDNTYLVTTIPPLHIAVSYGSVNAVNALLRLGADPSLRPHVAAVCLGLL